MNALKKSWLVAGLVLGGSVISGWSASEVKCRVELDRNVLFAGRRQTAVVKVTLDAPRAPTAGQRPPVNLTLVIDRSGSMSGKKIEKAKEAAIAALRRLSPRDIFSLVTYDTQVTTVVPAQSAANSEWIEGRIRSISTGGNTALFAGVSQGASEIRKHLEGKYIHRIILLSDGLANTGPSSPAELGRLGSALRKEGISVTTIGVGTDYNEDLMALMAQNSDGNNYFVESSADLPRIFSTELGDVLSVVASRVNIEVDFPEGVKPLRIIGRDGRVGEQQVTLSLNQLYGGQEKYALIEVELPPSSEGEIRKVAYAQCRYQNMIINQPGTSDGEIRVRFSKRPEEIERNVNIAVSKDVVLNFVAGGNDKVIWNVDNNKPTDAELIMRQNAQMLQSFGQKYNDISMQEEAQKLEKQADQIERNKRLSSSERKKLKSANFRTYNQQKAAPVK